MFNSRTRKSNETVSTFVNELRCIAAKCEYGLQLKENLRDRLVAGVNNETFQQRLLQNPGLTFESALTTCLAMETAAKNVHDLSQVAQTKASTVHKLQSNNNNYVGDNKKTTFYRCGRKHNPYVCWLKTQLVIFVGKLATLNQCVDRTNNKVKHL